LRVSFASAQKVADAQANNQTVTDGQWRGRFKLETEDGKKLILRGNQLTLSAAAATDVTDEVTFAVLDGNIRNTSSTATLPNVSDLFAHNSQF
jgi:hypothetical protein